jgi:hypothetical protein
MKPVYLNLKPFEENTMTPLTTREKQLISKNILAACKDITKLNKRGYDFINIASGFIAYYSEHSLQADIERYAKANQYSNFRKGEGYYDYYMAKRDCYNMILGGLVARDEMDAQNFMRDHFQIIHIA